jgi:putative membrane protein
MKVSLPCRQKGFALFIVLMVMIVVAFLVVIAAQSYNTEQRISANDSDRKLALTLAEAALRDGELHVLDLEEKEVTFSENCTDGLCAAPDVRTTADSKEKFGNITVEGNPTVEAWKRSCSNNSLCIDQGKEYGKGVEGVSKMPRYIIEYLGVENSRNIYRVTAKAWGKNSNTVVILQSYVSSE